MKLLDRGKLAFQDSSEDLLSVSTLKTKLSNNSNKINKIIIIIIIIIVIIIIIIIIVTITITSLKWNEKKPIKSLDQHNTHKFLDKCESIMRQMQITSLHIATMFKLSG